LKTKIQVLEVLKNKVTQKKNSIIDRWF